MSMPIARPSILIKDIPGKKNRPMKNARNNESTKRMRKIWKVFMVRIDWNGKAPNPVRYQRMFPPFPGAPSGLEICTCRSKAFKYRFLVKPSRGFLERNHPAETVLLPLLRRFSVRL